MIVMNDKVILQKFIKSENGIHVCDIVGLLKTLHSKWGRATIKSTIMTIGTT